MLRSAILSLFALANAEIIQIADLREVLTHIDSKTLTFIDLDDTLILPGQFIGHDYWLSQLAKDVAPEKLMALYKKNGSIRLVSELIPTQPDTQEILQKIQDQSLFCFGLTAQAAYTIEHTALLMKKLDMDMGRNVPLTMKNFAHAMSHGNFGGYVNGIIFSAGGSAKGEMANEVISQHIAGSAKLGDARFPFSKIVMIDDSRANLERLHTFFKSAGYADDNSYVGFHYVRPENVEHVEGFPAEFGNLQLKMSNWLDGVASDEVVWAALHQQTGDDSQHPLEKRADHLQHSSTEASEKKEEKREKKNLLKMKSLRF
eukprot:GDKJ01029749.1.p1 GENE.GDKJ01029749.1~~GDKJ01029749.1.p1  ORF type:complete len:316 (-),score=81.59 GDKJ01029749.1:1029-1976(-)